jgi:hypothetical protein
MCECKSFDQNNNGRAREIPYAQASFAKWQFEYYFNVAACKFYFP